MVGLRMCSDIPHDGLKLTRVREEEGYRPQKWPDYGAIEFIGKRLYVNTARYSHPPSTLGAASRLWGARTVLTGGAQHLHGGMGGAHARTHGKMGGAQHLHGGMGGAQAPTHGKMGGAQHLHDCLE